MSFCREYTMHYANDVSGIMIKLWIFCHSLNCVRFHNGNYTNKTDGLLRGF